MFFKRAYLFLSLALFSPLLGAPNWIGTVNSDWTQSFNWVPFGVPGPGDTITFPSVAARYTVDYSNLGSSPGFNDIVIDTTTTFYTFFGGGSIINFLPGATLHTVGPNAGTEIIGLLGINSQFGIDQSNPGTTIIGNIIEQSPSTIFISGTGVLTLLGQNSYTNGTILTGATLSIFQDANLGPTASPLTINGATLQLNADFTFTHRTTLGGAATIFTNNTVTYSGAISGAGSLTKQGTGTLILTGANSYAGGTTVSAGTLQGDATSLQGNITNNTQVVFDQATAGTYAGVMSGTGNFTKTNVGTLNLTNANTYTGSTSILAGTLAVNGSIAGSGVVVSPGATLTGAGTIKTPVTVNGTLAPGNPFGTMTTLAQVTFNSGSHFTADISPTSSDLLNVVGAGVTINSGATLNLLAAPGTYPDTVTHTLIHTTGGISGKFSTFTNNTPFLKASLEYTPTDLLLTFTLVNFTDVIGTGGNVGAVATCLDSSEAPTGSDMSNVIFSLMTIADPHAVKKAINQLQPSLYKGYALSQENMTIRIRSMISNRSAALSQNDCLKSCCVERGWTLWADGLGDWSQQHNQNHQIGYRANSGAGAIGADYQESDNFYVGVSGAYSSTDIDWNHHAADGGIQSYYGIIYGTRSWDHFFVDAAVIGAHNHYTGKRQIKFADVNRKARNKHSGNELSAHLNLGGLFAAGWLSINPFVSFDYIFLHQSGFKESGAKSLNLHIKKTHTNYVRGEAGLNINGCFETENSRWVPQLTLGVIREWRPGGKHYFSRLSGLDCTFKTTGLSPDRTLFTPGASVTALFCDERLSVELSYDAEFGRHFWDQNVNLQLGYSF